MTYECAVNITLVKHLIIRFKTGTSTSATHNVSIKCLAVRKQNAHFIAFGCCSQLLGTKQSFDKLCATGVHVFVLCVFH